VRPLDCVPFGLDRLVVGARHGRVRVSSSDQAFGLITLRVKIIILRSHLL
jgi:hypothetical protein